MSELTLDGLIECLRSVDYRAPRVSWMVRSDKLTPEQADRLDALHLPERPEPTKWLPPGVLALIFEEVRVAGEPLSSGNGKMIAITDGTWRPNELKEPVVQPNFRIAPCPS